MSMDTLKHIRDRCHEVGECWIWAQGLNSAGYPQGSHGGGAVNVRRHAYALRNGQAPDSRRRGLSMTCGNRLCVKPCHMQDVPRSQIVASGYSNGQRSNAAERLKRARNSARHVLDIDHARRIRQDDRTSAVVAAEIGCSPSLVRRIRRGQVWPDLVPGASVFARSAA